MWRTRDAGSSWEKLTKGLPQRNAHLGVLRAAMSIDHRQPRPLLPARARAGVREHRRRRQLDRARRLPAADLVGRGRNDPVMWPSPPPTNADSLFSGLPRRVEVEATTVNEGARQARTPLAETPRSSVRARPGAVSTSTSTSIRNARSSTRRSTSAHACTSSPRSPAANHLRPEPRGATGALAAGRAAHSRGGHRRDRTPASMRKASSDRRT